MTELDFFWVEYPMPIRTGELWPSRSIRVYLQHWSNSSAFSFL